MNAKEFGNFAAALRTYYSRENILPNQQAMELWFRQLQDIPYDAAEAILSKWVATNKWSPSIADIRDGMAEIQRGGPAPDWGDGWNQAMTAIRKFGSYGEEEALASLPPLTRETVRRLGYKSLCWSENQVADRANFRQVYEILEKRKIETDKIPLPVQQKLAALTAGFAKPMDDTPALPDASGRRPLDADEQAAIRRMFPDRHAQDPEMLAAIRRMFGGDAP